MKIGNWSLKILMGFASFLLLVLRLLKVTAMFPLLDGPASYQVVGGVMAYQADDP